MTEAPLQPRKIERKEKEIKPKENSKNHEFPQASTWVIFSKRHSPSLLLCTRKIGVISQKAHLGNDKQLHRRAGTFYKQPRPECSSLIWVLYQSIQCSVNWLVARANCILWRQRRAQHPLWLITNKYCNRNIWTVWYRDLQACSADTGFLRDFLALLTSRGYISVLDPVNVGCNVVAYALQFILFLANTFISNNKQYLIILYKL